MSNSNPPILNLFYRFGAPTVPVNDEEAKGDCPFCGKANHFYVHIGKEKEGCFECKRCGISGNKYTFLETIWQETRNHTKNSHYMSLGKKRNMPPGALKTANLAYNKLHEDDPGVWYIPIRNKKGSLVSLKTYDLSEKKPAPKSPSTCNVHFWGQDLLKDNTTIIICEGEWDAIHLHHLIQSSKPLKTQYSVLGCPSAGSVPKNFPDLLEGRDVILMYDHDEPGYKGMSRFIEKVPICKSLSTIVWPDSFGEGSDVSDYLTVNKAVEAETLVNNLLDFCESTKIAPTIASPLIELEEPRTNIEQVFQDFEESGFHLNDQLRKTIVVSAATCQSISIPGDPLWTFLVGASGSGKTTIIDAFSSYQNIIYQSQLTRESLFSGWAGGKSEEFSLIERLIGKCLALKEFTEILSLPPAALTELLGFMRGLYDGRVNRQFGNGKYLEFPVPGSGIDNCHFSQIAGVTGKIYSINNSDLGERYIRFPVHTDEVDYASQIRIALQSSQQNSHQYSRDLRQASINSFLDNNLIEAENLPKISEDFEVAITGLAQYTAFVRAIVNRGRGGELAYRPDPEVGNRLAKQFAKLAQSVGVMLHKEECDDEIFSYLTDTAFCTGKGFLQEIVWLLIDHLDGLSQHDICELAPISTSTVTRQLSNLLELRLVDVRTEIRHSRGRPQKIYSLTPMFRSLIDMGRVAEFRP